MNWKISCVMFFICQTCCKHQAVNLTEFYESSAWVGKKLAVPLRASNFGRQYAQALYEAGVPQFSGSIFCLELQVSKNHVLVCLSPTVLARNCMDSWFFLARKVLRTHSRACGWWRMALGWLECAWPTKGDGWWASVAMITCKGSFVTVYHPIR